MLCRELGMCEEGAAVLGQTQDPPSAPSLHSVQGKTGCSPHQECVVMLLSLLSPSVGSAEGGQQR